MRDLPGIVAGLVMLAACPSGATHAEPLVEELACADYQEVSRPEGVYSNNVWNKQAARGADWRQCVVRRGGEDGQIGWQWSWPERPRAVFGYPQIRIGTSPWVPQSPAGTALPKPLAALEALKVSHTLSGGSTGDFNVAASLWLGDDEIPGKDAIRAEIMIWTYTTPGQFRPAGKKVGKVVSDGREWQVWLDRHWGDVSQAHDNQWTYLVFKATDPAMSADTDVLSLLRYAEEVEYIEPDWIVYDLELGMEVMGGEGAVFLDDFEVTVAP